MFAAARQDWLLEEVFANWTVEVVIVLFDCIVRTTGNLLAEVFWLLCFLSKIFTRLLSMKFVLDFLQD